MVRPSFSVEFFPPKDEAGEERLWLSLERIVQLNPDFASVTYGANGSTRSRTIRLTQEITRRSAIPTVAHLTCVGSTEVELLEILQQYKNAGITKVLALRGDPEGGPGNPWREIPGGFNHADQLVQLARSLGFEVGVAAFPDGHPNSNGDLEQDLRVLLKKESLGASFATTQFFFSAERYFSLVEKLKHHGSDMPIIPGILPITNARQLQRMAILGGTEIPKRVLGDVEKIAEDGEAIRDYGIEFASKLSAELLNGGAPGLHFYTMNSSYSTEQIIKNLELGQ
jgi:methylenetetrahydrofolate reductase (NADPH)